MTRSCSFAIVALATGTLFAQTIHLKTRNLEPEADRQGYLGQPLKRRAGGISHYLVQFDAPVAAEHFGQLRARGIVVTGYLPDAALMIEASDGFSLEDLPVRWVGRLEDRDKISPRISSSGSARRLRAYVVEFHADVNMDEARAMVREHGLRAIAHPDLAAHHLLVRAGFDDLWRLASWDEVAYIFPASRELTTGVRVYACAGAIVQQTAVAQYATVGRGWTVTSPDGLVLGYRFAHLTDRVPAASTQSEILRGFNEWAKYVKLSWAPEGNAEAVRTVNILFASGAHGDPYPFDGPGGVLAHTFYPSPPNPEPIAGDMHLDDAERWQIGADMDLFSVVQHEAGHALGLAHTDNPNDVMYPYYRFGKHLSDGDIATVRSLYPARDGTTTPPPLPAAPLTLTVLSPAAGFTTTAGSIAASGTTAGGTGTVRVTWDTDGGQIGNATGSASWVIPGIPLNLGANHVIITAIDGATQTATQRISVTRQSSTTSPPGATPPPPPSSPSGDTTPPALRITYPASTIVATSLDTITLKGLASDNVGVTSVAWINSTGSSGMATGAMSWTALNIPLLRGNNNITIKAFDAAGNYGWRSVTVVRQ